ncbi:hypothetical protein DY000_02033087 [Brassica cretica]|uniref:Uncharacterized protein n=1 Tax=Brassica cretica TaxID=69181 RepID=A0ABQ7DKE8_BRACR|nr:hypothetical protein DY000_02033087 [Brassica cretica]
MPKAPESQPVAKRIVRIHKAVLPEGIFLEDSAVLVGPVEDVVEISVDDDNL